MTIPIALFMGVYLRFVRPGKVLECSLLGFVLFLVSIYGGKAVAVSPAWSPWFTWGGVALALVDHRLRISRQCSCPCGCCLRPAITSAPL